jgi:cell wall-associated NlpC family hydrolase
MGVTRVWPPMAVLLICGTALSACVSTRHLPKPPSMPAPPASAPAPAPVMPLPGVTGARPTGRTASDAAVDLALSLMGTPYRFGGETPGSGFDCSGLVVYVMAAQDIAMPRTVQEQYRVGVPVPATALRPGDLVFFTTTGPGATHVGIVSNAERREFVHAPNNGSTVRIDRLDADYWHRNWVGARRVL